MTPRAGASNPNSNLNRCSNSNSVEEEYEPKDRIESSQGSRLAPLAREFGPLRFRKRTSRGRLLQRYIIHPDNKWYHLWRNFMLGWAVYSSFFTPLEFGFFRGLPSKLFWLDIAGQIAFLIDITLHFFLTFRDEHAYRMIYKPTSIALRYLKSGFIIDLLGCLPWDLIYKVIRLQEEFSLPGEVIIEQGNAVEQLYFICEGVLEGVGIGEDGSEETILMLEPNSSFGEIAILCNTPQPYTVRVCDHCRLLRIDKQLFADILQIYFVDGRTVLSNLLEGNESNVRIKQLEYDVTFHIGKQEAELALRVNSAAFLGDLNHLKGLIRAGADPRKCDYDGRTPLHLAASGGFEDVTLFLIHEGVDINVSDKFGNTALFEAIRKGHDKVASLLFKNGATFSLSDAGSQLCSAVRMGDSNFLKRVLSYGIDPNSKDYDHRTPLHIAAAEGIFLIAKLLLENGASVFANDRWGTTPLDQVRKSGSKPLMRLMEEYKSEEMSKFPGRRGEEIQDRLHRRKCTVFPFHPWGPVEKKRGGVVLWVPRLMDDLIQSAQEQLKRPGTFILTEDGGRILDADMISDNQKLHLVTDQDMATK